MATEDTGLLVARVVADTEQFRAEMLALTKQVNTSTARINSALGKVDERTKAFGLSLGKLRAGFVALAGGAGIGLFVRSIVNAGVAMESFERKFKSAAGSTAAGRAELAYAKAEADRLGASFETLANQYANVVAAGRGTVLQGEQTRKIFTGVAEAARVMNLSAADTQGIFIALTQIMSKGIVTTQDLRQQLGDRIPGAFQIAADSMGKTTAQLNKLIASGKLTAAELLPKLAKGLHDTFSPDVAAAANDASAAFNRFHNAVFDVEVAFARSGLLDTLTLVAKWLGKMDDALVLARRGFLEMGSAALKSLAKLKQYSPSAWYNNLPFGLSFIPAGIRLLLSNTSAETLEREAAALQDQADAYAEMGKVPPPKNLPEKPQIPPITVPATVGKISTPRSPDLAYQTMKDAEADLTKYIQEQHDKRVTAAGKAAADEAQVQIAGQQAQLDFRAQMAQQAGQLLQALAGQSKAIALAGIAFEKWAAVKRVALQVEANAWGAFGSQLVFGDPSSYARAWKAYSTVKAAGSASIAQTAALAVVSGLAEAAQITRSTGSSGLVTGSLTTSGGTSALGGGVTALGNFRPSSTTVIFQGNLYGFDDYVQGRLIDAIRSAVDDRDVIIIGPNSRNAQELINGSS